MVAICCALLPLGGRGAPHPPATEPNLPPLTAAEIEELTALLRSSWQTTLETKFGVGWDSNLLLSGVAGDESAFSRASVEGMLWRSAREDRPVELIGFLNANYRRMFSSANLPEDTEAFLQAEARWHAAKSLKLSLLLQSFYLDTVLDLSTESARLATPLRTMGFNTGTTVRWESGSHWWVEATGTVDLSHYVQVPEDFQELRLGLRAGWQSADGKFKLGIGAREHDRHYRERNYTAIGGRPIAGTRLHYRSPELTINLERSVAWHGDWRLAGSFSEGRNDDNGSGYFNYRVGKFLASAAWTHALWEVQLSLAVSHYLWDVQVAGIGLDPPHRRRLDETVTVQVNRKLSEHWFLFVDTEQERISSNDPTAGYRLTVFSTGLGWKF